MGLYRIKTKQDGNPQPGVEVKISIDEGESYVGDTEAPNAVYDQDLPGEEGPWTAVLMDDDWNVVNNGARQVPMPGPDVVEFNIVPAP